MTRISSKPLPVPLAMSTAPAEATPSPVPPNQQEGNEESHTETQSKKTPRPYPERPAFPKSKLRLECKSLDHDGANIFFSNTNIASTFQNAIYTVLSTLYSPSRTNDHIPSTRSVTLVLRSMDGVAYTTSLELDDDHKEIHFSLDYIQAISSRNPGGESEEIRGVLVHEMVHCWQWNGMGTAPGGLIEGIADYVRLQAGLIPPHWKKEAGGQWDAGYQRTGYFLDWLESKIGHGSVKRINGALQQQKYENNLWLRLFGKSVNVLWNEYQESLETMPIKNDVF